MTQPQKYIPLISHSWVKQRHNAWTLYQRACNKLNKQVHLKRPYTLGLVEVMEFDHAGWLEGHVDNVNCIIAVISIGMTANFWYRSKKSCESVKNYIFTGNIKTGCYVVAIHNRSVLYNVSLFRPGFCSGKSAVK